MRALLRRLEPGRASAPRGVIWPVDHDHRHRWHGWPIQRASDERLLAEAIQLEANRVGHFTTALSDGERTYLRIMSELHQRGNLQQLAGSPSADPHFRARAAATQDGGDVCRAPA
jgi:hypothetical protein